MIEEIKENKSYYFNNGYNYAYITTIEKLRTIMLVTFTTRRFSDEHANIIMSIHSYYGNFGCTFLGTGNQSILPLVKSTIKDKNHFLAEITNGNHDIFNYEDTLEALENYIEQLRKNKDIDKQTYEKYKEKLQWLNIYPEDGPDEKAAFTNKFKVHLREIYEQGIFEYKYDIKPELVAFWEKIWVPFVKELTRENEESK